jgi:transposase-like protein
MDKLSYRRHRFPSIVIQQAVWLYFRFALSYRDVEDMLLNARQEIGEGFVTLTNDRRSEISGSARRIIQAPESRCADTGHRRCPYSKLRIAEKT